MPVGSDQGGTFRGLGRPISEQRGTPCVTMIVVTDRARDRISFGLLYDTDCSKLVSPSKLRGADS